MKPLIDVKFGALPLGALPLGALPLGVLSPESIERGFGPIVYHKGLRRACVAEVPDGPSGRALTVLYPKGGVGPDAGGTQFKVRLPRGFTELCLSYSLRFEAGFDFVLGGKLPGLVGGMANTGGERPNGSDGFSARMMWREHGSAVQYVYHPDQPGVWGEDLSYGFIAPWRFSPGTWHRVEHRIVLNTPGSPGKRDGVIEAWFDGKPALSRSNLRFRDDANILIDQFYFSTFFGGNTPDWAPVKDEVIAFDAFVVSVSR
jgi:hypothetical protein